MAIDSINFKNVNSIAPKKEVKEKEAPKTKEEIKDGKKKLALMATGAAAVAVAGIAIAMKIKGGKPIDRKVITEASEKAQDVAQNVAENASKKAQDVAQTVAQKAAEDVKIAKGATESISQIAQVAQKASNELPNDPKTFDDLIKLLPSPEDIEAGKGVIKIDGTNIPFECPPELSGNHRFLADLDGYLHRTSNKKTPSILLDTICYNKKTGKFILGKEFFIEGRKKPKYITMSYDPKTGEKSVLRKPHKYTPVRKTTNGCTKIDGYLKASRTTKILEDGTKEIYVYYHNEPYNKTIRITPDGKKTIE